MLTGFRVTVITVIIGVVLGLLTVGVLTAIHYSERTMRMILFIGVIVAVIFGVCIKKLPRAYMFSLLSIAMLMFAMWLGFVSNAPAIFKGLAGALAFCAGMFKIYFY